MSKGGGCDKSASANSVVVKQRWLFCILILILFVISANIGITALLLYYINVTNVSFVPGVQCCCGASGRPSNFVTWRSLALIH